MIFLRRLWKILRFTTSIRLPTITVNHVSAANVRPGVPSPCGKVRE
jgi:hypothetical protein